MGVYVTNLPLEYAKEDILIQPEYFGQYGKIRKTAINTKPLNNSASGLSTSGGGHNANQQQQNRSASASAYVTFANEKGYDAYHAILAADGAFLGGRHIKAAFGTTKYCSLFLRDIECTNKACMYLHEIGSPEDSFSKEDMIAGKHLLRELPAGIPPAVVYQTAPDFRPVLPPPGTMTRLAQAQRRAGEGQGGRHGGKDQQRSGGRNAGAQ